MDPQSNAKDRNALAERLSLPRTLEEEEFLPASFDFRGAAQRAFDFFSDRSEQGLKASQRLLDSVATPDETKQKQSSGCD